MRKKVRAFQIFAVAVILSVTGMLLFIQSTSFAKIVKNIVQNRLPKDVGVSADFKDFSILFFPPGIVINKPTIQLAKKNILGLPPDTKLESQRVEVTFQFFQLMTGSVTIRSLNIFGANLRLKLDEEFFEKHEKKLTQKKSTPSNGWQNLLKFSFRSVGLFDSDLNVGVVPSADRPGFSYKGFAKEFTVTKGTYDVPSYEIALNLKDSQIQNASLTKSVEELKANVELQLNRLAVRDLGIQNKNLYLHGNGIISGNIFKPKSLISEFSFILKGPANEWVQFLGVKADSIKGTASLEGKFKADLMRLNETMQVEGKTLLQEPHFQQWSAESIEATAKWYKSELNISGATGRIGKGLIKISDALIDFRRKSILSRAKIELENVDFREIMGSYLPKVYPLHLKASGTLDLKESTAQDSSGNRLLVQSSLRIKDFSFDNQSPLKKKPFFQLISVPDIGIHGSFEIGTSRLVFTDIRGSIGSSDLKLKGDIDFDKGFNLEVKGPVKLKDLKSLAGNEIRGDGQVVWTIKGKPDDLLMNFNVDLINAYYLRLHLGHVKGDILWNDRINTLQLKGLKAYQLDTELIGSGDVDLREGHDDVSLSIQVPKGGAQGFKAIMQDFIDRSIPWYPDTLTGDLAGAIKATGKTSLDQLVIEGDMRMRNFEFKGEIFGSGRFKAGYRKGAIFAEDIEVRKRNGWLKGYIVYGADEALDFNFETSGLSTTDIDFFGALSIPYIAPLEVRAVGKGRINQLTGSASLTFETGGIKNIMVPPTRMNIAAENGLIKGIFSGLGGQALAQIEIYSNSRASSNLSFSANRLDFKSLLIALNPNMAEDPSLEAMVSGRGYAQFAIDEISKLTGVIELDSFRLSKRNFEISLSRAFQLNVDKGNYSFEGLEFKGNGSRIGLKGRASDGMIDTQINGALNLSLVEFITPAIPSFRGALEFDAEFRGKADAPNYSCRGKIAGADLRLAAIEQSFENLNAQFIWKGNVLTVSGGTTKIGGGQVNGDGEAKLFFTKAPALNFRLDVNNPRFKIYPFTYIRMSGRLGVKGETLPYKVDGTLNVEEALIQEKFSSGDNGRALKTSQFLPKKNDGSSHEFQLFEMNLDTNIDRGLLVKNDLFDVEARGRVKVLGSMNAPRLLGQMEVTRGRLQFKDNFFNIQSATVTFNNPAVLDPEFDLTGSTELKGYKVSVFASGKSSSPNISFKSQPSLSQQDIVNLLTLGVTSSNFQALRSQDRDAYSGNEIYSLLFSQSGINKGLNEKLGVKVGVDQAVNTNTADSVFRPNTDASVNVAPRVYLQKEVFKNLNAKVGSTVGVGDSRQQDMNLEYRLGRNTSVLGVYEDQRGSTPRNTRTSLGVDLKFRWNFR